MPVDRMAAWIKKNGETKAVKDWLAANPPPTDFTGTPQQYAYSEMPDDGPVDQPLVPDDDEPLEAPVTRREHDALRDQVARVAKRFNNALKRTRTQVVDVPPSPAPAPEPAPAPGNAPRRGGVAAILDPLRRNRG